MTIWSGHTELEPGTVLRLVREDAGLSLRAVGRLPYFSAAYLCNLELGKRRVTPDVVESYLRAFGDDMHRRELLLGLIGGAATTAPLLRTAYELAVEASPLSTDGWQERVAAYEAEYATITGVADLRERVAADLARLRPNLDHPLLGVVAARLATLHGVLLASAMLDLREATRWFELGVRAADRSGSVPARVYARGRAAIDLIYHGAGSEAVDILARDALAISRRPSPGRLYAELALDCPDQAWDTLAALPEREVTTHSLSEWWVAHIVGRLAARRGDEALTTATIDGAERHLPADVTWPRPILDLQRALLLTRCGDRRGGIDHAVGVVDRLPPGESRPTVWRLLSEIEEGSGS